MAKYPQTYRRVTQADVGSLLQTFTPGTRFVSSIEQGTIVLRAEADQREAFRITQSEEGELVFLAPETRVS